VEGAEQPPRDAYVYAIRDEEAYLQVDDDKQPTPPASVAFSHLDPASILCQFCGKSWEQVPTLFQAKRRTMDPNTSAIVAVWICDECVAQSDVARGWHIRRTSAAPSGQPRSTP